MRLSLRHGRDPLWAATLPPEQLQALLGFEMAEQMDREEAEIKQKMARIRAAGGTVVKL